MSNIPRGDRISLRHILQWLARGEQLIIITPTRDSTEDLLAAFRRLSLEGKHILVVSSAAQPEGERQPGGGVLNPLAAKSIAQMSGLLRGRAKTMGRDGIILIGVSAEDRLWHGQNSVPRMLALLRRRNCRTVWIVPSGLLSGKTVGLVKDAADFFLHITEQSSGMQAQFISAKRQSDPLFFLPRRMKLTRDETYLESDPLPSPPGREDQTHAILEHVPYPIAVFFHDTVVVSNTAFRMHFAVDNNPPTLRDVVGRQNTTLVKELQSLLRGSADHTAPLICDVQIETRDRKNLTFELSAVPVPYRRGRGLLCTFMNITGRTTLARSIEESEIWYRQIVESAAGAIAVVHDGRCVFVNKAFLGLFGFSSSTDVVGKEISCIADAKDKKLLIGRVKKGDTPRGAGAAYEFIGKRADGTSLCIEALANPLMLGGQSMELNVYHDVTQTRHAIEELLEKTKRLEILHEIAVAAHRHQNTTGVIHESLKACIKELQFDSGAGYLLQPDHQRFTMVVHEGLPEPVVHTQEHQTAAEGVTGYVTKTMEPLVLATEDYPSFLPYGSLFTAHAIRHVVYIPVITQEIVTAIIMLASTKAKPMTSLTKAFLAAVGAEIGSSFGHAILHEQLRKSEERYRSLIDDSQVIFYRAAADGTFMFISPGVSRLLGHKPDDFYRSPGLWKTLIHPDDVSSYEAAVKEAHDTQIEYRMLPKGKASYRSVHDTIRCTRNAEGAAEIVSGVVHDVTESTQNTDAIVRSEHLKSSIVDSIQEGIVVYDTDLMCVDWNHAMQALTGTPRSAALGHHASELPLSALTRIQEPLLRKALAGTPADSVDIPFMLGEQRREGFLWARYSPLRDPSGTVKGAVGIVTEVTARRDLEREVRESEETLRNVIESMGDALIISDLEGKIWDVNKDFTRITGYERTEALGVSFPYPWIPDDELPRFATWLAMLREKNRLRDFDMSWNTKTGVPVAISLNTSLLRNAKDEPVAMVNIARDISDRKRLSTELERKNRQIEMLNRIISRANATMEFSEVFDTIAQEISSLTTYDEINVSLLNEDKQSQTPYAVRRPHGAEATTLGTAVALEGSPSQKAIAHGHGVVLAGAESVTGSDFQSHISIPIYLHKRVLGTFNLSSKVDHAYAGTELEFLRPIAEHIGAIIDRSRLYNKVHEQVRQATLLYELGKALTGTLDLKTILKTVYRRVRKALPLDEFVYGTFSPGTLLFIPLFEASEGKHHFQSHGLKRGSAQVMNDSVLWNVVMKGQSYVGDAVAPFASHGSVAIVSARSKKDAVGVLALISSTPRIYSDVHLRLLESIATLTEIAVDKATLYEEAIEQSAEIQRRNKELDDFTYVVSHDLKEPLISVEGYGKILLEDYRNSIGSEGAEYLSSILQSSARMKALINDLLTLSRVGRRTEQLVPVSCADVIQEVIHDMQFILDEKHVSVEVPDNLPVVQYIRTHLHMVFANLFSNAVKFNNKPDPRIIVRAAENEHQYVISVTDNGIGIDQRYFDKIFVIFQRLERSEQVPGTGAGLSIVKKIVESHNGKVWVTSTVGEGTTMNFTIPR